LLGVQQGGSAIQIGRSAFRDFCSVRRRPSYTKIPPMPSVADVNAVARKIVANVEQAIVGKRQQIILSLVAWFCEGHILLEDVPGVAKTMLARALAASVGSAFKRIQCTPDLLPSDVTGSSVFNQKTSEFEFRPGPIFAQIVLADEINRATPRTQAALLEAMAESRVTVDGVTRLARSSSMENRRHCAFARVC
jgi:MoxR-like ATPase